MGTTKYTFIKGRGYFLQYLSKGIRYVKTTTKLVQASGDTIPPKTQFYPTEQDALIAVKKLENWIAAKARAKRNRRR